MYILKSAIQLENYKLFMQFNLFTNMGVVNSIFKSKFLLYGIPKSFPFWSKYCSAALFLHCTAIYSYMLML